MSGNCFFLSCFFSFVSPNCKGRQFAFVGGVFAYPELQRAAGGDSSAVGVIRLWGGHNQISTRGRVYACQMFFVFRLHLFTRWAQIVEQQHFESEGFGEDPSPSGADSGNTMVFTHNGQ